MSAGKIPEGYVRGPGGLAIHPSCVHQVPNDALVTPQGNVVQEGKVTKSYPGCDYPTYRSFGAQDDAKLPMLTGASHNFEWEEADIIGIPNPGNPLGATEISQITGMWRVPPDPTEESAGRAWLALWVGLQNAYNTVLLQPVLVFNEGAGGGFSTSWDIASYAFVATPDNTCSKPPCFFDFVSTPIHVSVGDLIVGEATSVGCSLDRSSCTWIIQTCDWSKPGGPCSTLQVLAINVHFVRFEGAVLEFDAADGPPIDCAKSFPPSQAEMFFNLGLWVPTSQSNYNYVSTPSWYSHFMPATPWPAWPNCYWGIASSPTSQILFW